MSLRAIVCALVSSLGGYGDRYSGRITTADTAIGSEGIREGVGWVWGVWAAIQRLPATVGVVDESFVGILCVRGERNKIRAPKFPSRAPGDTIFGARDRGTMSVACRHLACRREMSKNVVSS